ncbi:MULTISPECIES: DUF2812 domain-containing protein [unclassified Lysinibacillus]|uniref:DUF2812 domain-containing protein n=1 Tax=unclassified Lysinibacillus TaxID=2636778 RepID=UPI0035E39CBE
MASQGWHLKKFTWIRFTFESGEPGSYIYRHDELERFGASYEDEYLEFLKSSGITGRSFWLYRILQEAR